MQLHTVTRRRALKWLAYSAIGLWSSRVFAAWNKSAFEATQTDIALQALQIKQSAIDNNIHITAPDKAENGAVVQVQIEWLGQPSPIAKSIALLAEKNPTPLIAKFDLSPIMLPRIVTRIKMAETEQLFALVESAAGFASQKKLITVLEDGCASSDHEEPFVSSIKMRARKTQEKAQSQVELKIIIVHPMRTGRSKNDDGQFMPPHFMQTMLVTLNDKPIIEAQTGTGISRNPYFTFFLRDGQIGDTIKVSWQDNQGYTGQDQVVIQA